jgi:hypothetical protein
MIIKCVAGEKLELSDTRLTELGDVNPSGCLPRYLKLKDLRAAWKKGYVKVIRVMPTFGGGILTTDVPFEPEIFKIGCRTFSPAAFAKILKAAGVKPVRKTKPAKKRKK